MLLIDELKQAALAAGADLVGVARASDLPEHADNMAAILPGALSVVVMASGHNRAALASLNPQAMQLEIGYTYDLAGQASKAAERLLLRRGHVAVAVPAFLPVDMAEPKYGLRGEICWRRAAVRAGLGSYGMNGLLVTERFGAAVRLSGLLTTAELPPGQPLESSACNQCGACLEACPAQALSAEGKVDKRRCGPQAMGLGFNRFRSVLECLATAPEEQRRAMLDGAQLRDLWQALMTGHYYTCAQCQVQCPQGQ